MTLTCALGYDPSLGYYVAINGQRLCVGTWFDKDLAETGLREEAINEHFRRWYKNAKQRPRP